MRTSSVAIASLLLALCVAAAEAQTIRSPYEYIETRHSLVGFAGYLSTNTGSLDLGPKSAPIFGGRYNIHFTGPLSGELNMGFAPTERTVYAAPGGAGSEPEALGDISSVIFLMDAGIRFNFTGPRTWNGFAPFAVGTMGLVADVTSADPLETSIDPEQHFEFGPGFAAGIGLGSNLFLSDGLSLRAEVRDYFWRLSTPGGLSETGGRELEWRQNFSFTLGVSIHF